MQRIAGWVLRVPASSLNQRAAHGCDPCFAGRAQTPMLGRISILAQDQRHQTRPKAVRRQ